MLIHPKTNMHLVLFFSRNASLKTWYEQGMLEREIALYNWYIKKGMRVSFITYGDIGDYAFQHNLPNIEILCNRWNLPSLLYGMLIPILHARALRKATIYKTNQLQGAQTAVLSAKIWRKPIIVRCGYLLSEFAAARNQKRPNVLRNIDFYEKKWCEKRFFSSASSVIVASPTMGNYISRNYSIPNSKLNVVPNHVLTDIFCPKPPKSFSKNICFVGRFIEQKNILALVEACVGIDVNLTLIGKGAMRDEISRTADLYKVNVKFLGVLPHEKLPEQLRQSSIYVHATLYEGSPPKSLLEAMSCGLPVIGSTVSGIKDLIEHGENGWLCGTSPKEIREAILTVMSDTKLQERMGRNARNLILEKFALNRTAPQEMELLKDFSRDAE